MKPYGKMGDSPYQLVIAGFLTHQGYECRTWFSHSVYGVTPNPAPSMGTNSSFAESCNQNKSCDHKTLFHSISPHSVVTLGVLTVMVKGRVARSRWRTGGARISSLFSWFRACMFVSSVNFRSFRVARTGVSGFCL